MAGQVGEDAFTLPFDIYLFSGSFTASNNGVIEFIVAPGTPFQWKLVENDKTIANKVLIAKGHTSFKIAAGTPMKATFDNTQNTSDTEVNYSLEMYVVI